MAIEDGYIVAECIAKYFGDPAQAFARYEDIRRERTATVVRKSHENRKSAFSPALDDPNAVGGRGRARVAAGARARADGVAVRV